MTPIPGSNDQAVLLDDALSIYQVAQLKAALCARLETTDTLLLDLSTVTEFDGAGLQLLVFLQQEIARRQGTLKLTGASANVTEALSLCGLSKGFNSLDVLPDTPTDAQPWVEDEPAYAPTTPLEA